MGREGPSVQMGSYIGDLVGKWGHILSGERKQLLAAGAGAGLAAAFAAPLAAATLVIESIERFDAPKTAITTILAGVVAGTIANMIFPINPYHEINAVAPDLSFSLQIKLFLLFAVIVSVFGKFYSLLMLYVKRLYPAIKQPEYIKLLGLLIMAYTISLTLTDLTGGGEQFLMEQALGGKESILWITGMMLLHMVFTVYSFSSGTAGWQFYSDTGNRGITRKDLCLIAGAAGHHRTGKYKLRHVDRDGCIPGCRGTYSHHRHSPDNRDHRPFRSVLSFDRCRRTDVLFYRVTGNKAFQRHVL